MAVPVGNPFNVVAPVVSGSATVGSTWTVKITSTHLELVEVKPALEDLSPRRLMALVCVIV